MCASFLFITGSLILIVVILRQFMRWWTRDRLVTDTVTLMSEIFGNERVYRLVGSRFAAFGFETDEAYFEDESERLIEEANKRNISLNVGFAFCNNGTKDMNTVVIPVPYILI